MIKLVVEIAFNVEDQLIKALLIKKQYEGNVFLRLTIISKKKNNVCIYIITNFLIY